MSVLVPFSFAVTDHNSSFSNFHAPKAQANKLVNYMIVQKPQFVTLLYPGNCMKMMTLKYFQRMSACFWLQLL